MLLPKGGSMTELVTTPFQGLFLVKTDIFCDGRGKFVKYFNASLFKENGLEYKFEEVYFSISRKNVLRGLHFQIPPADHAKIVYVSKGSVLDVALDIRRDSPTFGQCFSAILDENCGFCVFIPKGFAHGFLSLEKDSVFNSIQSSSYSAAYERGIRFDSFGFDWGCSCPVVSEKDSALPRFADFDTPF